DTRVQYCPDLDRTSQTTLTREVVANHGPSPSRQYYNGHSESTGPVMIQTIAITQADVQRASRAAWFYFTLYFCPSPSGLLYPLGGVMTLRLMHSQRARSSNRTGARWVPPTNHARRNLATHANTDAGQRCSSVFASLLWRSGNHGVCNWDATSITGHHGLHVVSQRMAERMEPKIRHQIRCFLEEALDLPKTPAEKMASRRASFTSR
ncbi:hypothetical protein BaRGS_00016177, partial [Batillaria attramentaria]